MDYPTARFDVFLSLTGTSMKSDQLQTREPFQVENREYLRFSGEDLTAGEAIELNLENLPRRWMKALQTSLFITTAFIFAGLLLYASLRRRRRPAAAGRNELIAEIMTLDDEFEGGDMPEEEYRTLRAEKKGRLVSIVHRLREKGGTYDG